MIWIYRLLFLPALVLAMPYYLLRMRRRGGYKKDFQHRFGRFRRLPPPEIGKKRVWLQAVSVGEVLAVGPLIDALQKNHEIEVILTTTTSTGYAEARKRYSGKVFSIGIFPLDFWLFSRTAWNRIQPDAIVLTESELWPEHLHRARENKVPAFLINARMSDRSFARYQKLKPFAKHLFGKLDHIYAASTLDQQRLIQLGSNPITTVATGSIKLDVEIGPRLNAGARAQLQTELGFPTGSFVLLGSSTWPGEEAALLATQAALIDSGIDCRLLMVPRHAERAPEIVKLLEAQPLSWHQRSTGEPAPVDLRIHLADTTGELTRLSQSADLAFIGKSLPPNEGGQTPIEAAGLGIPILMGPSMSNFKAVAHALLRDGVAETIETPEALASRAIELAKNTETRTRMSIAGSQWHTRNRGSSKRIAEGILIDLQPDENV